MHTLDNNIAVVVVEGKIQVILLRVGSSPPKCFPCPNVPTPRSILNICSSNGYILFEYYTAQILLDCSSYINKNFQERKAEGSRPLVIASSPYKHNLDWTLEFTIEMP
jgi:hypothetical protein